MLPSPGTGSIEHLEENVGPTGIELSPDEMQELGKPGVGAERGQRPTSSKRCHHLHRCRRPPQG